MVSGPPGSRSPYGPLRALKVVAGFALLIVGVVLAFPGVPGPGIPILLLGLWVLSGHFAWARRVSAWVRERTGRFRRTGNKREIAAE